jgi:hypothetical protein
VIEKSDLWASVDQSLAHTFLICHSHAPYINELIPSDLTSIHNRTAEYYKSIDDQMWGDETCRKYWIDVGTTMFSQINRSKGENTWVIQVTRWIFAYIRSLMSLGTTNLDGSEFYKVGIKICKTILDQMYVEKLL